MNDDAHTSSGCPLADVDLRLNDAHRLWHQAVEQYFDPEGFRVATQGCIQTLRSVTFILQSNKRAIPDFDHWYEAERTWMRSDTLMRWLVDARNCIEKRGDLRRTSYIKAEIVASYYDNSYPSMEVEAKLFEGAEKLVDRIPEWVLQKHVSRNGILRIQRIWRHNNLPEWEITELLAELYGKLSCLVDRAHTQAGLDTPSVTDDGRLLEKPLHLHGKLPCMIGHDQPRTFDLSLANGARLSVHSGNVRLKPEVADEVESRYGALATPDNSLESNEARLRYFFEMARIMFTRDGYHDVILFLLKNSGKAKLLQTAFADRQDKYIISRQIANEAQRHGTDAIIMMSECWFADMGPDRFLFPADAPDRRELLAGQLIERSGNSLTLHADIHRDGSRVSLGPTREVPEGRSFFFAPVLKMWGLEVPQMPTGDCGYSSV